MNKHLKYILLGSAFFLAGITSCQQVEQKEEIAKENDNFCLNDNFKKELTFSPAEMAEVTEHLTLPGNVGYNPDKLVHFVSLVGGIITNVKFSLGDEVKKGQLLAEIRSTELSSLVSEKKNLESRLAVANRQLESVQSMHESGISSQKELLEATTEVSIIQSELEKVKENLNLFSASPETGVFQIKAPASGFIVDKNITSGMQISGQDEPLFTISDLSEVWITVNVYAGNIGTVEKGMEVSIKTLAYPGEIFHGKITALPQILDPEAHVMKARIVMDNKDMKLKPGMLAEVILNKDFKTQAIRVPSKALIFDNNRNYLLSYHDDCNLEIKEVNLLAKNNATSFISTGLEPGEQIITQNHLLIYESLKHSKQQ